MKRSHQRARGHRLGITDHILTGIARESCHPIGARKDWELSCGIPQARHLSNLHHYVPAELPEAEFSVANALDELLPALDDVAV